MKLTLELQYMLSVLQSLFIYHARWCSGDFRSQSISRHGIGSQSWNIISSIRRVNPYHACWVQINALGVVSLRFRELSKIFSRHLCITESHTFDENFKLKLCTWAQSYALGTRTKFQHKILTINVISGIVYFRDIILESSRTLSETTPWLLKLPGLVTLAASVGRGVLCKLNHHGYWCPGSLCDPGHERSWYMCGTGQIWDRSFSVSSVWEGFNHSG